MATRNYHRQIFAALTAALISACGGPPPQDTPDPTEVFSIAGTVRGDLSAGVTLALDTDPPRTAITLADGTYVFADLPTASYTITPVHTGYYFIPAQRVIDVRGRKVIGADFTATAITDDSPPCGEGAVPASGCICDGVEQFLGHCCDDLWQESACAAPATCGEGAVPASGCICDGVEQYFGHCCDDLWQESACTAELHAISGVVSGDASSGITVTLTPDSFGAVQSKTTDAGGAYTFPDLADGRYTVAPEAPGLTFLPPALDVLVDGVDVTGADFVASSPPTGIIRVMCLGDSITRGNWQGGYRARLYDLLVTAGHTGFDFVGRSTDNHNDDNLGFTFPPEYWDHEGYNSATIDNSGSTYVWNQNVEAALTTNPPDVVLMMLGTNDVFSGSRNAEQIRASMNGLLDQLWAVDPDIRVVLSTIPRNFRDAGKEMIIEATNALWPGLVAEKQGEGRYILLVDNHAALTEASDFGDGVHPSISGYHKMAAAWYPGLVAASGF